MTKLIMLVFLTSCSLFHPTEQFEMERLSEDVLQSKSGKGVAITITPIDAQK